MTPTEINAAYVALQDEYPELATDDISSAACFLACLKACAEMEVEVTHVGRVWISDDGLVVWLLASNPHTITAVMDRVMQLPKVNA